MNRILTYLILVILLLGGLYYFLGELGLLSGLAAIFGYGSTQIKVANLKEENEALEKRKKEKEQQLKEIEEKQKELKVDDLTPEEEKDYWKNQ